MKPQNKVTIFMIVMIVMLSIYYFAMPDKSKPIDDPDDGTQDVIKSEEFEALRKVRNESRQAMIDELYTLIGTDVSPDQVKVALASIDQLKSYTQNESMLETELILAGFVDAYVEADADGNEVIVYLFVEELSALEAIEVIDQTKGRFGANIRVTTKYGFEVN